MEIEKLKEENRVLKNRCYVSTQGVLCIFCNLECKHNPKTNNQNSEDKEAE